MKAVRDAVAMIVLLLAAQVACAAKASSPTTRPRRMNVLFLISDDLRPELGCYGSPIKSPNIDALSARGLLFNRAYCQQALCSPSRTSLLTGRRPDTTRVYDLVTHFRKTIPHVVTLPQYFKEHGYFTQSIGKVYHGGLDDPLSWSVPSTPNRANEYATPDSIAEVHHKGAKGYEQGGRDKSAAWQIADVPDDQLPDGFIADHAIAALDQMKGRPFFLAVGFIKPHLPFVAPRRFYDLYPAATVGLSSCPNPPTDVPKIALTNFGELRAYDDIPRIGPVSDAQAKQLRRGYFAAVSFMDAQLGRVTAELDRLGLRDHTIVILFGDHGWHLGDLGQWCKHTDFEIACHAPLILSVPGMTTAGKKTDALVEFVDIYPTLCDLADLPTPDGLEGTSFAPLIANPNRAWKSAAFSQYPRARHVMGYTMRTDRYRYTEWYRGADHDHAIARELYDQKNDPMETRNIAQDLDQKEIVVELSRELRSGWKSAIPK